MSIKTLSICTTCTHNSYCVLIPQKHKVWDCSDLQISLDISLPKTSIKPEIVMV